MREFGFILAVVGLGNLLAFAQTVRHLAVNRVAAALSLLMVPLFVAALWRLSQDIGWWTALVFVVESLIVGVLHAKVARQHGVAAIYSMQSLHGLTALMCVSASWAL